MSARASGEALGDGFNETELRGAGQNEAARARIRIYRALKIGKQSRTALDFIHDGSARGLAEKTARIRSRKLPGVRVFEREVRLLRCQQPGERRFPGLPPAP